jgi:hypothetical protein
MLFLAAIIPIFRGIHMAVDCCKILNPKYAYYLVFETDVQNVSYVMAGLFQEVLFLQNRLRPTALSFAEAGTQSQKPFPSLRLPVCLSLLVSNHAAIRSLKARQEKMRVTPKCLSQSLI